MFRVCVFVFFAACTLCIFGETLSCDECGLQCAEMCGTRQFRACCFNSMRKRQSDIWLSPWMKPRRYALRWRTAFDNRENEDAE